ncbi:hypothetical protein ACJ72_07310 [Emergomyces africanus]|uniref:Uncharacterized protein n=1 Tax=Emergomyces africanus TaxID=1955775 RepID=A0A1B7NNI4_9EURO|nr:hypothetical protein ACJ72_07310 [Emergomyces africanus]
MCNLIRLLFSLPKFLRSSNIPLHLNGRVSCWTVWLKDYKKMCPYIDDLSHLSADTKFLELLFAGGHSYLFKNHGSNEMYERWILLLLNVKYMITNIMGANDDQHNI